MLSPHDLVRSMFDALAREDWLGAARFFNPAQLEEWYRDLLQTRTSGLESSVSTDDLLRHHPDMPIEAAEYQVAEFRKHRSEGYRQLAGVESWEEAEQLGPVGAYARYLQERDPRQQILAITPNLKPELQAELAKIDPSFRQVVLGGVTEGADLVHVLYRRYLAENDDATSLHVVTCSRGQAMTGG